MQHPQCNTTFPTGVSELLLPYNAVGSERMLPYAVLCCQDPDAGEGSWWIASVHALF